MRVLNQRKADKKIKNIHWEVKHYVMVRFGKAW